MDEKKQTQSQNNKPAVSSAQKSSNKALFWILGGCLALLLVGGLVVGGLMYWSYKKVKKEIKERKPKIEQWESNLEKMREQTKPTAEETLMEISEEGTISEDSLSLYPPAVTEKAMGFIKKVYVKNAKNFLDIDYIQWFMGAEAEKAMRQDSKCLKTGECLVLDDYYIRNQNPQLRTFEIAPDVEITMQTYDMETTGQIQVQKISFSQFSQIWSTNTKPYLKNVPYHIGIGNNKILSISEQYVP